MDPDQIEKMLKKDPNLIKHEILKTDDRIVLTASTKQLQEFMIKHANDEGLFDDPRNFKKLKTKTSSDPNNISKKNKKR